MERSLGKHQQRRPWNAFAVGAGARISVFDAQLGVGKDFAGGVSAGLGLFLGTAHAKLEHVEPARRHLRKARNLGRKLPADLASELGL